MIHGSRRTNVTTLRSDLTRLEKVQQLTFVHVLLSTLGGGRIYMAVDYSLFLNLS